MLDSTTSFLFSTYPREITRKRSLVRNEEEFICRLDLVNGVEDAFTNVNSLDGSIDKIFNDFDGALSLPESQKMYQYLLYKNYPCIPVASGKKGIHLYVLARSRRGEDNKDVLFRATKSLLIKGLGESLGSCDSHPIGDLRRLCRIPNTLRPPENCSYCTYLPPSKGFLEMTNTDLCWYVKGTHTYQMEDYLSSGLPTFDEMIIPEVEKLKLSIPEETQSTKGFIENEFLKHILRPCLYRLITTEEPRHHVRVATTVDLMKTGLSQSEIIEVFRSLKWADWNEDTTSYQVAHCKPIVYSKKRLRELGVCFDCGRSCF